MHTLIQHYMSVFKKAEGSDKARVQFIIMHYADEWEWIGGDSLIADILDDRSMTSADMIEMLKSIIEFEGGNAEFKSAVIAMESTLRREREAQRPANTDNVLDLNFSVDNDDYEYENYRQAV